VLSQDGECITSLMLRPERCRRQHDPPPLRIKPQPKLLLSTLHQHRELHHTTTFTHSHSHSHIISVLGISSQTSTTHTYVGISTPIPVHSASRAICLHFAFQIPDTFKMSDTEAAVANGGAKENMSQQDIDFLLTCIKNTTGGVLTVS